MGRCTFQCSHQQHTKKPMQDTTSRFLRVLRFLLVSKTKHKLLEIQGTISLCVLSCFITVGNHGSVVLILLKKIALKRAAISKYRKAAR
mmetsp:Transcript_43103/g.58864  ORF Transcript_43103/g.58864 Transcript_43103/m.58864 type:complete len:89 (+) Transcript_43103:668-934(+)